MNYEIVPINIEVETFAHTTDKFPTSYIAVYDTLNHKIVDDQEVEYCGTYYYWDNDVSKRYIRVISTEAIRSMMTDSNITTEFLGFKYKLVCIFNNGRKLIWKKIERSGSNA